MSWHGHASEVGRRLLRAGRRLLRAGSRLLRAGSRLLRAGSRLLRAGSRLLRAGRRLLRAGGVRGPAGASQQIDDVGREALAILAREATHVVVHLAGVVHHAEARGRPKLGLHV